MNLVLTAAHGRTEIFKTFINHVPYPMVIAGSDDENYDYWQECKKGDYLVCENKPLGKKWNTGLAHCRQYDFDYLIITGSDDLFCSKLWGWYETLDVHYAGFTDLYIHDNGRVKYYKGYSRNRLGEPQGAGRALHHNVLDALDWKLWDDDLNIGLDASMTLRLNKLSLTKEIIRLVDNDFVAIDIKTSDNLHSSSEYEGEWLSETEANYILSKWS